MITSIVTSHVITPVVTSQCDHPAAVDLFQTVSGEKLFTLVKTLVHHKVVSLSMGAHHTAVVVEPGHVYMMGRNSEAQLGLGNTKQYSAPIEVKLFNEKPALVSQSCH